MMALAVCAQEVCCSNRILARPCSITSVFVIMILPFTSGDQRIWPQTVGRGGRGGFDIK